MSSDAPLRSPPRQPRRQTRGRGNSRGGRGRGNHGQQDVRPGSGTAVQAEAPVVDDAEDDKMTVASSEVCIICASPVVYTAVAPCNHQTCHICSLRLRALYKTKACAHCRTSSDFVVFSKTEKEYLEFKDIDIAVTDAALGIRFTDATIREDTLLILRYNCPDSKCDVACLSWSDLHHHVRKAHQKVMCDLCTQNKKVFTHEHDLFTAQQLRQHQERGDDKPGAIDQSGFRGHPKCGFCREYFYGDDELYTHCREKHERCHICDRRTPGRPHYYLNYDTLEAHFGKHHFLCLDKECLEKKFVVFESELDFKAHKLEVHPNGLTKDARRVDLTNFVVREPYHPPNRGRDGRARGRGREPPAEREPIPQSSAQPLRRDELAFQRQLAIQSTQRPTPTANDRRFNGQLTVETSGDPSRTQSAQLHPSVPPVLEVRQSLLETVDIPPDRTTPVSAHDQRRHQAVLTRAAQLFKNDDVKIREFQAWVSRYNRDAATALELVDSVAAFSGAGPDDTPSSEVGTFIRELAELFEARPKRDDLMAAWHDRRTRNEVEDYPTLPAGAPAPTAGGAAGPAWHAGARVLRLKSATAQSSRLPVGRTAAWGSAAAGGSGGKTGSGGGSPWATGAGAPTSVAGAVTASGSGPRPTTTKKTAAAALGGRPGGSSAKQRAGLADAAAFPALPAAQAPASAGFTVFTPGSTGGRVVRRDVGRGTTANAWDSGGAGGAWGAGGASAAAEADDEGEAGAPGRAKKSGRKKQTLMHFG